MIDRYKAKADQKNIINIRSGGGLVILVILVIIFTIFMYGSVFWPKAPQPASLPGQVAFSPLDLTEEAWYAWRGFDPARVSGELPADGLFVRAITQFPIDLNEIFEVEPVGLSLSPPVNDFTLVTRFSLDSVEKLPPLGLQLAELGENWSIYLNGHLIRHEMFRSETGDIQVRRSVQKIIVLLPATLLRPGENVLLLHFAGTAPLLGYLSGWSPGFPLSTGYQIASLAELTSAHNLNSGITMLQIGIYLFFGVYQLLFYFYHRQSVENLYLGLYLLHFGGGWLFFNSSLIFELYPNTTFLTRMSYFFAVASSVIIVYLWFFFFPKKTLPVWMRWFIYYLLAVGWGMLLFPFVWIEPLLRGFLYTIPLVIAIAFYLAARALYLRLADSGKIFFVIFLACVFTAWDWFDVQKFHTGFIFAGFTPFLISFTLAIIITNGFWKYYTEAGRLNQELARANQALLVGKETLEEQVRLRTSELQEEVLERARARKMAELRATEAETLQQATSAIAGTLEPRQMINRVLEHLVRVVPYDSASVQLRRQDNSTEIIATRGFTNNALWIGKKYYQGVDSLPGAVYQTFQPLVVKNLSIEFPEFVHPEENTVRGWMCVPLVTRGRAIGHMTLASSIPDRFTDHDARLALTFAGQVALALVNAQAFQDARRRAEELEMLYEIGLALSSGLEMDKALWTVYEQSKRFAQIDAFYIALYDPDSGQISYPIIRDRSRPLNSVSEYTASLTSWVIKNRKTLYLDGLKTLPVNLDVDLPSSQNIIQSYVGVPMMLRERVIGVISMQSYLPDNFTSDQIRFLETMANQAAIAIDNGRLYQQTQQELVLRRQAENSLRKANILLEELAIRDSLTGLFNRRYLEETLMRQLEKARRENSPLCIVMMDIDNFKNFNDIYGHQAGDQVLSTLGRLLIQNSRKSDVACRYGGEEIVLVLPNTSIEVAEQRAESIRQKLALLNIRVGSKNLSATISLGVAEYPQHGQSAEILLRKADEAMYQAKQAGRNRLERAPSSTGT